VHFGSTVTRQALTRMKPRCVCLSICLAISVLMFGPPAFAQTGGRESLDKVNKELSNPISSIWALQLQENTYWLNKPDRNVVNLQFQPVLPLALTDDWNLIDELDALRQRDRPSSSRYRLRGHDPGDADFGKSEIGRSCS
jgi:hypothetical protein